jgi:hypothetical protein
MSAKNPTCHYCRSSEREMEVDPVVYSTKEHPVYRCADRLPCNVDQLELTIATKQRFRATALESVATVDHLIEHFTGQLTKKRAELAQRGGAA